MLDMGFIHDVKRVLAKTPDRKQTLLFSATVPEEIAEIARHLLHKPVKVAVTPVSSAVDVYKRQGGNSGEPYRGPAEKAGMGARNRQCLRP